MRVQISILCDIGKLLNYHDDAGSNLDSVWRREIIELSWDLTLLNFEVGIIIPTSWNVGNIKIKHLYKSPSTLSGKWNLRIMTIYIDQQMFQGLGWRNTVVGTMEGMQRPGLAGSLLRGWGCKDEGWKVQETWPTLCWWETLTNKRDTGNEYSKFKEESSLWIGQIKEGFLEEAEMDFVVLFATGNLSWLFSDWAERE